MLRILFTGVGRRVELIQAFCDAAFHLGVDLKIYGADMDMSAPALAWCDCARKICAIRDSEYIPQLLEMCRTEGIDLLIPTIDTDLLKLAESRPDFEAAGTKVFISDSDKVALCRDKRLTGAFFESCGLRAPRTFDDWRKYSGPYPCFIKPKDGSSSIDAYRVETREQLEAYASKVADYVVQPFVKGREYTIDVFCDYKGAILSVVPRERVAVRAGEVLKTRVAMDERMIAEARVLAETFRPRGPMTVQLIRDDATGEDWFIEINPRYGGGAPLSMRAGARTAELALTIAAGGVPEPIEFAAISDNAAYSRFDQCVRTDVPQDLRDVRGIVFDLDDTLYMERDYVRSGFRSVAKYLGDASAETEMWEAFLDGRPAIDDYTERHVCADLRDELLNIYRTHMPDLKLDRQARDLLVRLRNKGLKIGIITDGRPGGQRAKLDTLGLWNLVDDVVITDELGGIQFRKPCDIAFRIIQRRWGIPFEEMIYVGDNPMKDFQAPKQLGIGCVWYCNLNGLYQYNGKLPILTVTDISELRCMLQHML